MKHSESALFDQAVQALDSFQIEIPSWGFANTGTRFGKFVQAAAASTLEEKFADAAEVNRLTGATPTLALHVLWDLPNGVARRGRGAEPRAPIRRPRRLHQSQSLSGSGIQVRLALQSLGGDSRAGPGARARFDRDRQAPRLRATFLSGSPTAQTIPARKASASASAGLRRPCARPTTTSRRTSDC